MRQEGNDYQEKGKMGRRLIGAMVLIIVLVFGASLASRLGVETGSRTWYYAWVMGALVASIIGMIAKG